MEIRLLRADEIECRVAMVKKNNYGIGCSLLLYKDARCDMNILDEVFGPLGWERSHQVINNSLFCTVTVYDAEHDRWVSKQDVGTESNEEKEKGQSSDSFKRACFNLGIGRELYTAPFIWVNLSDDEVVDKGNNKYACYKKFTVKSVTYENKKIVSLVIMDDKGKVRYTLNAPNQTENVPATKGEEVNVQHEETPQEAPQEPQTTSPGPKGKRLSDKQLTRLFFIAKGKGYTEEQVTKAGMKRYNVTDLHDLKKADYDAMCKGYESIASKKAN